MTEILRLQCCMISSVSRKKMKLLLTIKRNYCTYTTTELLQDSSGFIEAVIKYNNYH